MAFYRAGQAAAYCGVSKSYIDKLRCRGEGPTFSRLGRAVVYDSDDLDRWLAANRRAANDNHKANGRTVA